MRIVYLGNKLVAIVVLVILSGCQNSDQRAEEREKFGVELFNKGEYKKAALEFNSALKDDGTRATSYYYLALVDEKNKRYRIMRKNLTQAIKFAPDHVKARIELGKVLLLLDDLDGVLAESEAILKYSKNNNEGLLLKAAAYIKQNKQGDALTLIEEILEKTPDNIEAISLKTLILMKNERFDRALMLVNPVIESGIDDISLHLLKIQLDAKLNNIDAVIADYERLAKLYSDKKEFKFALAKIYSQANRKQDAENLLREMVDSKPLEASYKLVLLDFLNSVGKEQAINQLQKFVDSNLDKPELLFQMSQWLYKKMYLTETKALLIKIDQLKGSSKIQKKVKLLLAVVFFHEKELDKSSVIVEELIKQESENLPAKILKAKIFIARDKNEEAERLLTKVLWANPKSDESLVLLAQIELRKGYSAKADKKYREALKVNPANMTALASVVNRSLKNNDNDYASELVLKALMLKPNNLVLLRDLAEIKILSRDWEGAKQILESLEKQPKGDMLAKLLKGKLYKEQGDCVQAVSVFKEILSESPAFPDVLRQLAACHELMGQRTELIAYMGAFIEKNPKNIVSYLIMGKLFSLDNKFEKASDIYNKALKINKKVPQIYAALAALYSKQKKYDEAIKTYRLGLEENIDNVRLSIYLAAVYQEIKDYTKSATVFEALLAVNPKLEIAINNYAALLVDFLGDKESIEKARKLVARFENSENPFYLDSFAWVELKMGNINQAVILLEKVNSITELAVFKYHLGVAYHKNGNDSGAVTQLQQAIDLGKQKGGFDENELAQKLLDELSLAAK